MKVIIPPEILKEPQVLIVPLTKSPHAPRPGPRERWDWVRGCEKAVVIGEQMRRMGLDPKILILSDVRVNGFRHEADIYLEEINRLNKRPWVVRWVVKEGLETKSQIEKALKLGREERRAVIFVSTWLHYPRVRWLARGEGAFHFGVFGIPWWREAVTDIFLATLYPIIEKASLADWFSEVVSRRRAAGVH